MTSLANKILEIIPQDKPIDRASLAIDANYDSVGRVLSELVRERKLVRVGRGKYRKPATRSSMSVNTIGERIESRLSKSRRNVFLRNDFIEFGSYDAVGRALRQLTTDGRLVQIGSGLYAKAKRSEITGKAAPLVGIKKLATEAMKRLGQPVFPSSMEIAYNEGRSTQVPTGRTLAVQKPPRRKIGYNGQYVVFERA